MQKTIILAVFSSLIIVCVSAQFFSINRTQVNNNILHDYYRAL